MSVWSRHPHSKIVAKLYQFRVKLIYVNQEDRLSFSNEKPRVICKVWIALTHYVKDMEVVGSKTCPDNALKFEGCIL
jgi:hypothetical protein